MLFYRLLLTLLAPAFALWFGLRLLRGQERPADLRERLGCGTGAETGNGTAIWLHGASNGELISARNLIESLLERGPSLRIVVTSNSLSGRDMVRSWALPRVTARLAPLDYRRALTRFVETCRPAAFLLIEGDLWPNRLVLTARRGIPVVMVSARISERSARKWRRLPGLARQMLQAVELALPQDFASGQRLLALGLPAAALHAPVTLKSEVSLPPADPAQLAALSGVFEPGRTFLAASTHAGEEEIVIAAFVQARRHRPGLRMILAPRHPARGPGIAALLDETGLGYRVRSAGQDPDPGAPVYLADTLGEMALWYTLSDTCLVGGSLVPKGGHTPYEPARFDCVLLHGPHVSNFAEQEAALDRAGGAIGVTGTGYLAAALRPRDEATQRTMTEAARAALALDRPDNSVNDVLVALGKLDGLAVLLER
ncbi:3-deoxy-D-manno-octulosonic acid transferase [Tropicimonas sp.]|uniref:3-deoxy-D-manno-octulosonic acid transferase n=1 Tax=Tropicimonas sp. TaxID=2067044 RepID=UPI003A867195